MQSLDMSTTSSETNLRRLFASAKAQRKDLDSYHDTTTSLYQEHLIAAITIFEECRDLASRLAIFSTNEGEDDISSGDIQYDSISYG